MHLSRGLCQIRISPGTWGGASTYDKAEGEDIRRKVHAAGGVGLWAPLHWISKSNSADIQVRRNRTAHLKIAYLDCFDFNDAIGLLVVVHEDVVGLDIL
jgi:hypothetical protein